MASGTRSTNRGRGRNGGRVQGRGAEFVTRNELRMEMGRLRANIQAMFDQARHGESGMHDHTLEDGIPIIPTAVPVARRCDFKMFLDCKPPTYLGERDPVKAMRWLKEIEAIFKTSKCADEDRVLYGTAMFKSDALYWWEGFIESEGAEVYSSNSWNEFAIAFKRQFCPQATVKELEEEFMNLHQQGLSVKDYTASFIEKSRFAEYFVATEKLKVERYIFGLSSEIRKLVTAREPKTFSEAVDAAEHVEQDVGRDDEYTGSGKRKMEETAYESEEDDLQENDNYQEYDSYEMRCSRCHGIHQGDCYGDDRKCYKCGKLGHIAKNCHITRHCFYCNSPEHLQRECPHWKEQQDSEMVRSESIETGEMYRSEISKGKGKVFQAMGQEEEEETYEDGAGMCL